MGPSNPTPGFTASEDIRPMRFVTLDADSGKNFQVEECDADQYVLGISHDSGRRAPGVDSTSTLAAKDGDPLSVFMPGSVANLVIGTGGCTAGDLLVSGADGEGLAVADPAAEDFFYVGAIALETRLDTQVALVLIQPQFFGYVDTQ